MKIVGLELMPGNERSVAVCFLTETLDDVIKLDGDEELIKKVEAFRPDIVAIGSPLSLPEKGNIRKAEQELSKRNLKFRYPIGLLAVEQVVMRGIGLKNHFQSKGFLVIETFPNGFYELIRIPKKDNYADVKRFLKIYKINLERRNYTQEELNSIISAFTGRLFLDAKVEFLGDENEGQIVLPRVINY